MSISARVIGFDRNRTGETIDMRHPTLEAAIARTRTQIIVLMAMLIALSRFAVTAPPQSVEQMIVWASVLYCMTATGIAILVLHMYLSTPRPGPNPGLPIESDPVRCGVVSFI